MALVENKYTDLKGERKVTRFKEGLVLALILIGTLLMTIGMPTCNAAARPHKYLINILNFGREN
jgi:hypothetical protein